jgi:hypothetical protein
MRLIHPCRRALEDAYSLFRNVLGCGEHSAPHLRGQLYLAAVSAGNCVIEFTEIAPLTGARRLLGKERFMNIVHLSIDLPHHKACSTAALPGPYPFSTLFNLFSVFASKVALSPHASIRTLPEDQQHQGDLMERSGLGVTAVKEIVLSCGEKWQRREQLSRVLYSAEAVSIARAEVYRTGGEMPALRLIPSLTSALIFKVESLERALESLSEQGVQVEFVGRSGANAGQVVCVHLCTGYASLTLDAGTADPSLSVWFGCAGM